MLKFLATLAIVIPVTAVTVALLIAVWPNLGLFGNLFLWSLLVLFWTASGLGLYLLWTKASVHRAKAFSIRVEAMKIDSNNSAVMTANGQVVQLAPGFYGNLSNLRQIGASGIEALRGGPQTVQAIPVQEAQLPQPPQSEVALEFPWPASMEDYLPDEGFIYRKGELFAAIGVNIEGNLVGAGVSEFPHIALGGKSRFGKSTCALALVYQALSTELVEDTRGTVKLALADKTGLTFSPELWNNLPQLFGGDVAFGEAAIIRLFEDLKLECNLRGQLFRSLAKRNLYPQKLGQYNQMVQANERLPYILLIIEEFNELCRESKEIKELAQALANESAKYGVTIVAMGQNFTMQATGHMKNQLATKVFFGEIDRGTRAMFDFASKLQVSEEVKGRGLIKIPGHRHQEIQGLYIQEEKVIELVQTLKEQAAMQQVNNFTNTYAQTNQGKQPQTQASNNEDWQNFIDEVQTSAPVTFGANVPRLPAGIIFDTSTGGSSDMLQIDEAVYTVISAKDERNFVEPVANEVTANGFAPDYIPEPQVPPQLTPEEAQMLALVARIEKQVGYASFRQLYPLAKMAGLGGETAVQQIIRQLKDYGLVNNSGPRGAYRLTDFGERFVVKK